MVGSTLSPFKDLEKIGAGGRGEEGSGPPAPTGVVPRTDGALGGPSVDPPAWAEGGALTGPPIFDTGTVLG